MLIATRRNPSARQAALLRARADGLRKTPTLSEARLWRELSAGKVLGVHFRRQVPLGGRFVADFFAPALGLVVEVDGSAHEHRRRADARRDEKFRRLGYVVLRLDAELVVRDVPGAVALIREAVERLAG
jgi:very-short-patch-repair endonuclease